MKTVQKNTRIPLRKLKQSKKRISLAVLTLQNNVKTSIFDH